MGLKEKNVTTIVLIEPHPLMRLGLHQMLSRADTPWEIVALDPEDIASYDSENQPVALLLYGLPADCDGIWPIIHQVESQLRPEHTLLLADDCPPRDFPVRNSESKVF